ncbi:hypothetical protein FJZ53_03980 [Candidatus Woesearchaeota archaeon]|nr:hypothetical protein [Candidatus Woesearchaeota archaeon]
MTKKLKVVFVCTGNIFRSVAAEYCLKDYLKNKGINNIIAKSAGISATPQQMHPTIPKALSNYGIDITKHKQSKLTREIVDISDVVIAMSKSHQDFIKEEFEIYAPLFNELALQKNESILDVNEAIPDYHVNPKAVNEYIKKTVAYIHEMTPKVSEALQTVLADKSKGKNL